MKAEGPGGPEDYAERGKRPEVGATWSRRRSARVTTSLPPAPAGDLCIDHREQRCALSDPPRQQDHGLCAQGSRDGKRPGQPDRCGGDRRFRSRTSNMSKRGCARHHGFARLRTPEPRQLSRADRRQDRHRAGPPARQRGVYRLCAVRRPGDRRGRHPAARFHRHLLPERGARHPDAYFYGKTVDDEGNLVMPEELAASSAVSGRRGDASSNASGETSLPGDRLLPNEAVCWRKAPVSGIKHDFFVLNR